MTATRHIREAWIEGDRVRVKLTPDAPAETLETLRAVKPAILLIHEAAGIARCNEPLHVLIHEFRQDLELMAAGTWTVQTVATAITTIGPGYGWQFKREKAA